MVERLLVVVPAFNEERSIAQVVESIMQSDYSVLVVDDGSTDHTAQTAQRVGAKVLRLPMNFGVGAALRAGFRYAVSHGYETVVQVDADGQHPAAEIQNLLIAAQQRSAHLVIGSRFTSDDETMPLSITRKASMRLLAIYMSLVIGCRVTDTTSGFRLIRRPLLDAFSEEFPDYYLGDTFEATVAAARAGYVITEVPASLRPRMFGASTASPVRATNMLVKALALTVLNLHPRLANFKSHAE